MPTSGLPRLGPSRLRARLAAPLRTVVLAAVLLLPVALLAGWFDRLTSAIEISGRRVPRQASTALENAVRHIVAVPASAESVVLAAEGTQEGHWRFVNKAGEMFTVGTPDEMKRVISVLYPGAKTTARLTLYMTDDTIFRNRAALKALPATADLNVVSGKEAHRLLRRGEAAGERLFAEVRPNLVVEMADRRQFEEALWQLAQPLKKAGLRVLALEPGGPSTLSAAPRVDPASGRALVDVVDPASLAPAMGALAGQTLVLLGRIDRDLLYVQPSSGAERSLLMRDLLKAADDADANLIVLQAATTPRQPDGRNWLWQKVRVQGLDDALQGARMADLLNGLGTPSRRLAVAALPDGRRTVVELTPAGDLPGGGAGVTRQVSELFSGIVADLTAKVATTAVQASLRSAQRQRELDYRLVPGVASELQITYLVLAMLGLLGVPLSRVWWARIWPPETASEYAGRAGYWAGCAVRFLAYALLFVPLTAIVAGPHNLASQIWEALTGPARLWRRLRGSPPGPPPLPTTRSPPPSSRPPPLPPRLPPGLAGGQRAGPLATPSNSGRDWPPLEGPSLDNPYRLNRN